MSRPADSINRTSLWIGYVRVTVVSLICLIVVENAFAQVPRRQDPLRFLTWTAEDVGGLIPAIGQVPPLDWAIAGAGVFVAHRFDKTINSRAEGLADREYMRVIDEFGNIKAIRPMSLLIFIGSLMQRNQRFQDAAFTSLEAIVFTNLMVNGLKTLFGRSRPWQEQGPNAISPFSGDTSFPSGHAATVFAFVTPWVFFYPHLATYTLFGLGAGTAFTRVATGHHWFSDVVAGSAIGFATAYWLSRRHAGGGVTSRVDPVLGLNRIGVQLKF